MRSAEEVCNHAKTFSSLTILPVAPFRVAADGDGYSLELIDGNMDNSLASSWKRSERVFGSPYNMNTLLEIEANVYPNPFIDEVIINVQNISLSDETFMLDIFNLFGRRLKSASADSYNSEIHISMKNLPSGVYFIRILPVGNGEFKSRVLKVVKQ